MLFINPYLYIPTFSLALNGDGCLEVGIKMCFISLYQTAYTISVITYIVKYTIRALWNSIMNIGIIFVKLVISWSGGWHGIWEGIVILLKGC